MYSLLGEMRNRGPSWKNDLTDAGIWSFILELSPVLERQVVVDTMHAATC